MPEQPSWIAVLDHLMQGSPWTLSRGAIPMGPSFDQWTLEGHGMGALGFFQRGRSPDEAVANALVHIAHHHNLDLHVVRAQLEQQQLKRELAQREAQAKAESRAAAKRPARPLNEWRGGPGPIRERCESESGGRVVYGYEGPDGAVEGPFDSVAQAQAAHRQAMEAAAA
jgi:hypothetical protein